MPIRFDPLAELDRLARTVGQLFDRPSSAVAVARSDAELCLTVDLPGVKTGDIDVTVDVGGVVVRAVRRAAPPPIGSTPAGGEGSTPREIELRHDLDPADPVDVAGVTASFEDGVLTVRLPRAAGSRPRRVEVRHAGDRPVGPAAGDPPGAPAAGSDAAGGTAAGIVSPPPEEQGNPLPTS